jgi:hypothetical protein
MTSTQRQAKRKRAKATKPSAEPKPIAASIVRKFIFEMEDGRTAIADFATTLALLSETMEEYIGIIVQRHAHEILQAHRQVDEQITTLFKLAGGKG